MEKSAQHEEMRKVIGDMIEIQKLAGSVIDADECAAAIRSRFPCSDLSAGAISKLVKEEAKRRGAAVFDGGEVGES